MTIPVFDGHNDVVLRLDEGGRSFVEESSDGHLDLPRARRGGFAGGLFAIFVSGPEEGDMGGKPTGPYSFPLAPSIATEVAVARADHLEEILRGLEAEGAIRLRHERGADRGVLRRRERSPPSCISRARSRSSAPTTSNAATTGGFVPSASCGAAQTAMPRECRFGFPPLPTPGPGLSEEGRHLVRACNRLGILVDLSHLNMRGFFDVADLSEAPLVASHSNAHAICPSTRNLTDEQLDTISGSGGLVGINFAVGFLREDGLLEPESTPLDTVVRHIDYLVDRMGIDCVGLGSDYEGAAPPAELGDVTRLPALFDALRERGYDDDRWRRSPTATGFGCFARPGASRAGGRTRTGGPRFTKPLLYQLSYSGAAGARVASDAVFTV